ncbi:hypothetical protein NW752_003547 [Fusarium irregulare]|uniref:Uncharacterized protein n=1 Tax=Fusarium irregulare TaxID=2494466 RepID=A0A9W8UBJ5_9HYPO|nr:hypothetical protein NW766_004617 [Fusarium irregulare]KAJ4023087.1 hypothetical protein NW752_003547 [Fusarium irregulare]
MDRSRRMPQRRRPLGASASPTSTSEASFDFNPITSPVVAQTNTTPGGRRSTKPLQHAFTFSPPSSSRNSNPKRRSTTMDNFPMQDEGEHGPKKGGHSLRKRARVDYTFEHIDDDVVVPNSTSSARGKKRRSEINFDTDDFYNNDSKRRGASMGADTPSSRRRNPTRKSSDLKAFHQAALQDDDNEVQDTIEVGAYYSDVDDSELRDGADSNNSSPQSKMSPKTSPQKSPQNESTKNELPAPQFHNGFQIGPSTENAASSSEVNQVLSEKPYPAVEHISNSIEELVSQPAEPQAENFPNAEPEPATYNYQQPSTTLEADYPLTPLETAVPSTKPEPAASATALTVPDISIKAEEAEPAAVSVSAPELAPTIAQLPITADENNQSEPIHLPIVPASQPEPANIISELPPAEPTSQLNPEPESLTSSTTTIIEEKEEPHQPIVEQVEQEQIPEPPTQLPDQHQEDKMDKMDIDPLLEENVPQDIEMTDAAAIDTPAAQDKVSTPSPEPTSTSALGPADLPSPLPSNTIPSSPPKSPAKLRSPSPAQEDEQLPQETIIPSPNADTDEIRMSVELSNDHQTETENVNKEVVEENNEDKEPEPVEAPVTADEPQVPDSPQNHITQEEPAIVSSPLEPKAPTPPPAETIETPASSAPSETKPSPQKPVAPRVPLEFMPQPTPVGRWSHLKPYVEGEFTMYPEKKGNEDGNDDVTPEGKDADRDADMEPMVDDQDDAGLEAPTPALNTPTRGSPVPDSADPTALNSPAPAGEDGDEADESQELSERTRYYKYRKLRDPEEYVSVLENYEDMSTEELYELLEAVNVSMVQWQDEWTEQGAIVDDYENSLRRRAADSKYEARTRNLHQHGINYEEPEFAVKGYKSREKEGLTETRYLQGQDRIMAATYGFEYDPHPSKIGKQNPETQQVGVMTRGRSLRNQPRQTAKATEGEEVVGKRQRKPVQLFDPTTQDVSRSSTPVPATRATGRRRKNANAEDEPQSNLAVSFTSEVVSDGEGPKTRRKRGTRSKNAVQEEEAVPTPDTEEVVQESPQKPTRRGRARPAVKYEEADPNEFVDEEPQEEEEEVMEEPEENEKEKEEKPTIRRHLVTLKLPSGYFEATPEMEIVDNGDSRPTTACSEESSQTVESSYSFRPKRQKRFRDDPDETEESAQAPPKKRGKRTSGGTTVADVPSTASTPVPSTESAQPINSRKIQKIKVVRSGQDTKNGGTPQATPAPPPPPPPPAPATPTPTPGPVDDNDDTPKDYKSMTKSEKMSASMKNRWANGNMAGAVEKRKATLAAKKAAQAAAEQRTGVVAPKPKGKTPMKRDSTLKMQMAPEQPQMPLQQQPPPPPHMMHQQPPPMHPHQHQHHPHQYPVHHQHPQHHHQHPPPPPPHPAHMQQMHHPQHMPPHPPPPPPHQPGNPPPPFMHGHGQHPNHGHSHGMPGMGYHY